MHLSTLLFGVASLAAATHAASIPNGEPQLEARQGTEQVYLQTTVHQGLLSQPRPEGCVLRLLSSSVRPTNATKRVVNRINTESERSEWKEAKAEEQMMAAQVAMNEALNCLARLRRQKRALKSKGSWDGASWAPVP
ncbi:hypothetical protein B0J13DRAFT_223154 [Dactylonectria estremocensis]|uniref:Uncharacterized protein n=1 Tax=Dactylonectria estremocensis TaxID=1079267 RepID=A0A9P9JCT7_9HYPO|nr:hypothetical protein B0J13DRAFT_223154 [Dactylonectria estremocensis]